jgi:gamma-glutamyltranspeptidase/glutathione hydrolase
MTLLSLLLAAIAPTVQPPTFPNAAVAADHQIASETGLEVLRAGGNAVDAAVAVSFTLSVVRPESCGIGGGGFMLIHLNTPQGPKDIALNYREQAFAKASADYYVNKADDLASTRGGAAVAIPGTVAGLLHAQATYGKLDRAAVLTPAIRAAVTGFRADAHILESVKGAHALFEKRPDFAARFSDLDRRYLRGGGLKSGELITNPEHAQALELIARDGAAAFYSGPIAHAIVRAIQSDGGDITLADLASFKVETLTPFSINFRGDTILTMPPPSSGGVVVGEILGILQRRPDDLAAAIAAGPTSAAYIHLVAEASKHGFADRARWLGDSASARAAATHLTSPAYLDDLASRIDSGAVLPQERYGSTPPSPAAPAEDGGTSHFCVIDAMGNAVSCTETINLEFGSFLVVPEYGFLLNDQMDDFTARPGKANAFGLKQSEANAPGPGKRPLSSMTPTIVTRNGSVKLLVGASGGPRIISGTLQTALKVLLFDQPASDAVASPRFHHQWDPDILGLERTLLSSPAAEELKTLGHAVRARGDVSHTQLIRVRDDGTKEPASDPRKGGVPAGY